jgi:phosphatidylglycerol:prolipoprotein diacylglycerol transferase
VIDIPFDPNLISIGPFTISWHGLFTVLGIVGGVWLAIRLARSRIPEERTYSVATWGVVGGIVGARVLHVVDQWDVYAQDPLAILAIWNGGIAIVGAIIGGIAAGYVRALMLRIPVGFAADAAAPAMPLGLAIGRIGDIINGEHHAVACRDLPWCVRYTHPATLGQREYVHPAVAYEMILDFAIVGLVLWLWPRFAGRPPEGRLLLIFLCLYGVGRFFISFLRLDDIVFLGLRQAQLVSLAMFLVSVVMLTYAGLRPRRETAQTT